MAAIGTFCIVILITVLSAFLNGWFWMMGYELGIAPLINYLGVAPAIPYMFFVLLCLAWTLIKLKNVDYNINKWKNKLCSSCEIFTDIDHSYMPIGYLVEKGGLKAVLEYVKG